MFDPVDFGTGFDLSIHPVADANRFTPWGHDRLRDWSVDGI